MTTILEANNVQIDLIWGGGRRAKQEVKGTIIIIITT